MVGPQLLAAPIMKVIDIDLISDPMIRDQITQSGSQGDVVTEHQDRLVQ